MNRVTKGVLILFVLTILIAALTACGGKGENYVYVTFTNGAYYTVLPSEVAEDGRLRAERDEDYKFSIQVSQGYDITTLTVKLNGNQIFGLKRSDANDIMDYTIRISSNATLLIVEPTLLFMDVTFSAKAADGTVFGDNYSSFFITYVVPASGSKVTKTLKDVTDGEKVKVPYGTEFEFEVFSSDNARYLGSSVKVIAWTEATNKGEFKTIGENGLTLGKNYSLVPYSDYALSFNANELTLAEYAISDRTSTETELIKLTLDGSTYDDAKTLRVDLKHYHISDVPYQSMTVKIGEDLEFSMQGNGQEVQSDQNGHYLEIPLSKRAPTLYAGARSGQFFDIYVLGIIPQGTYKTVNIGFADEAFFYHKRNAAYGTSLPYHVEYDLDGEKKVVYYTQPEYFTMVLTLPKKYSYGQSNFLLNSSSLSPLNIKGIYLQRVFESEEGSADAYYYSDGISLAKYFGGDSQSSDYVTILLTLPANQNYVLQIRDYKD